jgi:hypothetical protein
VPAKSDALWFFEHRRRGSPPDGLSVTINGEAVPANLRMRYLGLIIDSQWMFGPHFELLVPRVTTAANALRGLHLNSG